MCYILVLNNNLNGPKIIIYCNFIIIYYYLTFYLINKLV